MNGNHYSVNRSRRKDGFIKSEDLCYDDDGFFSDVPSSGSLSKSRIALNKYLKKNLLYEDVDYKDDSAYFSKEGSPNDSVSKSDNESVKSNESHKTKRSLSHDASITDFVKSYETSRQNLSRPRSYEPKICFDKQITTKWGTNIATNSEFETSGILSEKVSSEKNAKETNKTFELNIDDEGLNITKPREEKKPLSQNCSNAEITKVYPKEKWPDKYRRKSDTIKVKPIEFYRATRSLSLDVSLGEWPNKYMINNDKEHHDQWNQLNQLLLQNETNNPTKPYESDQTGLFRGRKPNKNETKNNNTESIIINSTANHKLPASKIYESYNSYPQKECIAVSETNTREIISTSENGNHKHESEQNVKNEKKIRTHTASQHVPHNDIVSAHKLYSKPESITETTNRPYLNSDSESVNSDTCVTKKTLPQEAKIVITKIIKTPDPMQLPHHKDFCDNRNNILKVPKVDTQNLNNRMSPERLPSPVPLPRNESLKRNYRPKVPQRTIYSYDYDTENRTPKKEYPNRPEPLKTNDYIFGHVPLEKVKSTDYDETANVEQTDDYKSLQLQKPKEYESSADSKHTPLSASLSNLSTDDKPDDVTEKPVVMREKSNKMEEHRHTLHDFTGWVNRTTKYPDVYAPMPYKSPRRYVESDVNIHYRCPVRHDPLPLVPERELARQQAEHMKRLYREQRRNKYLQELQDMQSRRHQDNFLPKEKSIVPLNRYDEAERVVARALYAFNGQTARELSFRKGDLIHVRRQIDANWYEGELHGRVGLFPYNYVEILKGDVAQSPRKPAVIEGRARAKFDFTAQTNLELPLKKGELVVLTRRIDHNWWEGRNGTRTGIFPDSYITVLQEPSQTKPEPESILSNQKPVASPAAHGLMNGSAKRSMGPHSYMPQPNSPALSNAPQPTQPLTGYTAKPAQATLTPSERGYGPPAAPALDLNNTEPLYVDTNAEAVPYRAMYKYRPQNPDELELAEGDTVYVLEQCDDGWYVGSSQRTGRFGTFPGNYVERI